MRRITNMRANGSAPSPLSATYQVRLWQEGNQSNVLGIPFSCARSLSVLDGQIAPTAVDSSPLVRIGGGPISAKRPQ